MTRPRSSTPAILALGEADARIQPGARGAPDDYLHGFGGDTSNMAIAAARLGGAASGYATRVGNDAFGRMLLDLWRAKASTRPASRRCRSADRRLLRDARRAGPRILVPARGLCSEPDAAGSRCRTTSFALHGCSTCRASARRSPRRRATPCSRRSNRAGGGRRRHVRSQRAAQAVAARAGAGRHHGDDRAVHWFLPSVDEAVILFGTLAPTRSSTPCIARARAASC